MKKLLCVIALVAFGSLTLAAQNAAPPRDTVSLSANAEVEAAPDLAVVSFSVSVQETSRAKAYEHASAIAEQIRATLRKHEIDAKSANVGGFTLAPVYDYTAKRKLKGFRVDFDVQLKLRDFAKAADLAEEFGSLDNASETSLGYELADPEAARKNAIVKAIEKARAEAEIAAAAGGRKLGRMTNLSIGEIEMPVHITRGVMKRAALALNEAPTEGFTPSSKKISAHVTVEFLLE